MTKLNVFFYVLSGVTMLDLLFLILVDWIDNLFINYFY